MSRRQGRAYRALLWLFPADFRADFGHDLEQLFEDRLREARDRGEGAARLWAAAVIDVVWEATREWGGRGRRAARAVIAEGVTMNGWLRDIRFGLRSMVRRPAFTAAAVATLALGIGATVAIFSVVNGVLLRPLPFPDPDRLVVLWNVDAQSGARGRSVDHPDIRLWQQEVPGFDVAGYAGARPTLTGLGRPEVVYGMRVTDGLLTLLGATPLLGRDLTAADDVQDGPLVAVVSHTFWSERLGRDPDVIGTTITLGGEPWEIVGVAREDFEFPAGVDLWMPRRHEVDGCGHGCRIMSAIGRVRSDATIEQVQASLDAVSDRLASAEPDSHRDQVVELQPLLDSEVGDVRAGLWVLFGAVGMVLLIACANVANLLMVRANQRRAEMALRASLGASRTRIFRQLLTESLLLSISAGVLGLGIAYWGTGALVALAPEGLPRLAEAGLDPTVGLFTAGLVLLVTSAFGVLPAMHLSGGLGQEASSGRRAAGGRRAGLSRSFLIAGEVSLSLSLLLGAGLLFRTLVEINSVEYGFNTEASERFRLSIPESRYDSLGIVRFIDELEARLAALPGVAAVGSGFGVPLSSGNISASATLLDRPEPDPADAPEFSLRPSSPGFLDASGTRLLAGRWFTDRDRYGEEAVAVINETATRVHYDGMDPIGRQILADVTWSFELTAPLTIVGVVEDVRTESAVGAPRAALYLPNAQFGANSVYVWLRTRPGMETVVPDARAVLAELDGELAITDVTTIRDVIAAERDAPLFYLTLLTVFSVLALVLASIGLYGVISYSVSERRREIGIRIALGAASVEVVRMVVGQGARPVVAGVVLGLLMSAAGSRVLESLLFGVRPLDPLTFGTVTLLLLVVASIATVLPARAASRISPNQALRAE